MKDGILIIGRFSGFHRGHVELIRRAHLDHPDKPIIIAVVVGKKSSKDLNKNPFTFEERRNMIEKILNKLNIKAGIIQVPSAYIPDLVKLLKEEHSIDIKYVYCGADRLNSYLQQNLESMGIKVVYLERDTSDTDPTKRASATRVRNAVKNNDFEEFKELMPEEIGEDTLLDIFNSLREAMRLKGIELQASTVIGGIPHIEDLDAEEFVEWLEDFYNEKILAIQKLDGTFNMSVLKTDDGIAFARLAKGQMETFTADDLPKTPIYNALRGACTALEVPEVEDIIDKYLDVGDAIDIEVLYGDQPNTIRYNLKHNYLAFLRFITGKSGEEAEKLLGNLVEELRWLEVEINNTVYFYNWETENIDSKVQRETWRFAKPGVLEKLSERIDFTKDLESLKDWLNSKNDLIPQLTNLEVMGINLNKIKIIEQPQYREAKKKLLKEAREKAQKEALKRKLNIKNKMIESILKNANFEIGGSEQEGLVLRNLDTGKMIKLVDKDAFTKENKKNWYYMELATKGVKIDDEFVPGITAKFFDFCASILNIPMLRLKEKFWKNLKAGEYDIKTNIKNYIIDKDIQVPNVAEKLVLIKRKAVESLDDLRKLKNEALNDRSLTETIRERTLNSLGLVNDSFKKVINDLDFLINSVEFNKSDNEDQLAECIFVLLKNFLNI